VLHEKLPAHHRQDDTQYTIRLVAAIFVVVTSLVLGLMINTAKSRFESINRDAHAFATHLILLDRTLRQYGPDANDARQRLLAYAQRAATGKWTSDGSHVVADRASEQLLTEVGSSLRALRPADAEPLAVWNDARQQFRKAVELRWLLVEQSEGSIPSPLLVMVVAWLVLIFGSFGYRAPRNLAVAGTLVVAAALIASSLYVILDMDEPFSGPVQISPAPLQRAVAEMQR
jgi:hypothetical protein